MSRVQVPPTASDEPLDINELRILHELLLQAVHTTNAYKVGDFEIIGFLNRRLVAIRNKAAAAPPPPEPSDGRRRKPLAAVDEEQSDDASDSDPDTDAAAAAPVKVQ